MTPTFPEHPRPGSAQWLTDGVLYCYPPIEHTEPNVRDYYARIGAAIAERDGVYVTLGDTRHVKTLPSARIRKLHGELGGALGRRYAGRCLLSVSIVDNPAMRAAIAAVLWLVGDPTHPQSVVGCPAEALAIAMRTVRDTHRGVSAAS